MHQDTIVTPLEPFTPEEEAALFDKLDLLSVAELENYIGLAQNSLRHKGLDPTWRPRVAVGLKRAEEVLVRESAAAALRAANPEPEPIAPPTKTKATAKSKKAAAAAAAVGTVDSDDDDADDDAPKSASDTDADESKDE